MRLPTRYALLCTAILACLVSLGLAVHRIYTTERALGYDVGENIVWSMAQNEVELQRFLDVLGRYGRNEPGVDRDELLLRFDLLWSRLAVPSKGDLAARLARVDRGREVLDRARLALASVEDRVAGLAPGASAAAGAIAAELRPLLGELHEAAVQSVHAETAYQLARDETRQRELLTALGLLGGALAATGLLVALLVGELRRGRGLTVLARDAEAAAKLSEQRLRDILECSTDWIWETDARHRFTLHSSNLLARPIDQPEATIGSTRFNQRLPEDDDDAGWQQHREALEARLPFRDFVYAFRSRQGERRWARVHGRPVFDDAGAFVGYRGTGRDITAERAAEQALRDSRALLRAVIDAVPAIINVKDREGRYVLMNRFQAEVYGTDPEEAVGRISSDFTGSEYGSESRQLDLEVIESGKGTAFVERPFVDAAGQRRVWWSAKHPLTDADGSVRHVVTVAMDITELKDAERVRQNLSRYFSPNMVDLLAQRDEPLGQVRAQDVAVVFTDLFDFTRFAAHQPPEEVMATLRDLHARLTDIVLAHGGTLEKFLGDGIMATFGTPWPTGADASRALAATGEIVEMIQAWNAEREAAGRAPLRIGIGAHIGPVLLGEIGSARRVEFAVVGETVNLASRLQELTRVLLTPAVVSRSLLDAAAAEGPDGRRHGTPFEAVEPQSVDGFDEPVAVAVYKPAEAKTSAAAALPAS